MNKTHFAAHQTITVIPLVMRTLAAELRHTGHLPAHSHFSVLVMLAERETCNLSELAEHQAVSLPSMSNTISKLVEKGWVQRLQSEQDRRQVLISLTAQGRRRLLEIERLAKSRIEARLQPLSPADRDALVAGLAVLQAVFTDSYHPEAREEDGR